MLLRVSGLCLVLVLGVMAGSAAADSDFLTAQEIQANIIGGTITGTTAENAMWSETYHTDGSFSGAGVDGGVLGGRWEIQDDFLCVIYDGDPVASCRAIRLDGDTIRYVSEHGSDGGHGTLTH